MPAKGTDRHSSSRSFCRDVEESPFKSQNTSVQKLSSSFDFLSSSDDDIVMKERLNENLHKYDKENSGENNNNNNNNNNNTKKREQLILDKRLKDERNTSQISHQKEVKTDPDNETDVTNRNTRRKSIESESFGEYADCNPSCRNSEHFKKPVPLPRSRTQKKFPNSSKTHEKEVHESHQQILRASSSLSPLLPAVHLRHPIIAADDGSDSSDCVLPQKSERKEEKTEMNALSNVEKQEEIELRNLKTSAVEVDGKEVLSSRKSFHKSRRESREVAVESALMTEEPKSVELSYDKIVGIIIHRSECLQIDPLVQHPLVKVHLLDSSTGNYLKKSNLGRSVSFYFENQEVDYILPLMTEKFDYKERR
jgi:hypothetical protein